AASSRTRGSDTNEARLSAAGTDPVKAIGPADPGDGAGEVAAAAASRIPRLSRWSRSGLVGLAVLAFWFFIAAFGPWMMPHSITDMGAAGVFEKISFTHPFGTDYLGRDVLSRIMDGT